MTQMLSDVDALLDRPDDLPPAHVRGWLRKADGLTQEQVARVLGVKRLAVTRWEAGTTEPRAPHRAAYAHLLRRLATKYPNAMAHSSTNPPQAG